MWNITSGESWMQVIFTGTKSSLTCVHFTVPELDVVTWNTSAQSRQMGMLNCNIFHMINVFTHFNQKNVRVFKAKDIPVHLTLNLVQHFFPFSWFQDSLVDPKAHLRGRYCSPLFSQDHMSKIVCYPFFSVTLWWDLLFLPLSVWLQVCFERHGYT